MDFQIILVYCLCADFLKALHHPEDKQCQMSDAEVMTTALVAALYFGGNQERARGFLLGQKYIPQMLSKSQFRRRLHRLFRNARHFNPNDLLAEYCQGNFDDVGLHGQVYNLLAAPLRLPATG